MTYYLFLLIVYLPVYLLAMLLAPVLPLFSTMRDGNLENNNERGVGPRLPLWLAWFDTPDNSLDGDYGWRTKHCREDWAFYWGHVKWLWRNPANGFSWEVLSHHVSHNETFTYTHSGNDLDVDKGKGKFGWYYIKSSEGAFSLRWCRRFLGVIWSLEAGWLLDIYIKDPSSRLTTPKAKFQFQPQIKPGREKCFD